MKIIDERGRFKINVVDIVIIIFLCCFIVGLAFVINNFKQAEPQEAVRIWEKTVQCETCNRAMVGRFLHGEKPEDINESKVCGHCGNTQVVNYGRVENPKSYYLRVVDNFVYLEER